MKTLFVIAATFSCFGLAMQPTAKTQSVTNQAPAQAIALEVEQPVMTVLLDTVTITPVAPQAVAANVR